MTQESNIEGVPSHQLLPGQSFATYTSMDQI